MSRRVLFVTHTAELGGAEQVNLQVVERLCSLGWTVTLAGPREGVFPQLARAAGAAFQVLPLRLLDRGVPIVSWLSSLRALGRCARGLAAECLVATSTSALAWCGPVGRRLRTPAVLTLHDDDLGFPTSVFLGLVAQVITPGHSNERLLQGRGVSPRSIEVIPNAVGRAFERDALPALTPAAGRPFTVGFVGRVHPNKGVDLVIDAARSLDGEARFQIIGKPSFGARYERDLAGRSAALVRSQRLSFRGFLCGEELVQAIAALDLLVLPSYQELYPLVLLEAMALGVPVIASDVGDSSTLVVHERTGLLIPSGSAEALVSAIRRLRDDDALRARVRAGAFELARAHSLSTLQRRYVETLERVIQRHAA